MKNKSKTILSVMTAGALALALLPGSAHAVPTLTMVAGATTVTVADNGAGDSVPLAGNVTYVGSVGANWNLNINSGTTKPLFGSATSPFMDLSFNAQSLGAGSITITFSEVGFAFVGNLIDAWGGTAAGTVLNQVQKNGTTFITQGPLGPGGFTSTTSGLVSLVGTDTLSLVVVINHTDRQITTGDKLVTGVPDGGTTVLLLGAALSGLGLIRRKLVA